MINSLWTGLSEPIVPEEDDEEDDDAPPPGGFDLLAAIAEYDSRFRGEE